MNNEVEAFVGELRQLREREVKLAKVVTAVEELLQRGMERSHNYNDVDAMCINNLKRTVEDFDVANWIDKMRHEGRADPTRFTDGTPPFGAGTY